MVQKFKKNRLSWYKQEQLIEHYISGSTARCVGELLGLNHKTSAYYFHRLREIIAYELELASDEMFSGEIEVDESYFGGVRKGKRRRGAGGKTIVFGLLKRGGKVYTKIVPNVKKDTLMSNIKNKVVPDSIVYTDSLPSYNALVVSDFKHKRINHCKTFVDGYNHINGIENFWNQATSGWA